MSTPRKQQRGKPARKKVVKTFDNTPATDSQPAPPIRGDIPPPHTKAEIAAVAAHIVCEHKGLVPINANIVPLAVAMAVELLDAAEQASKQRGVLRALLEAEAAPEAQIKFEDGVKRITGDAKRLGRAKATYRKFWEWRRWTQGKHSADAADKMWELHELNTIWTPQSLEEEKALFDDWKKRGRPKASERRGRPREFDLRGNSPHPPPTSGRAKEKSDESGGSERKLKK